MSAFQTIGFGCPNDIDPHHFTVVIPQGRTDDIIITEHFGLRGGSDGIPELVERCHLNRNAWRGIAEEAKRVLNERLKEKKLSTSRWSIGENKVERLLGKELCVLAWAAEAAEESLIPLAVASWAALRPEERWWLFSMAAHATGTSEDVDIGWRKALRIAFTENPSQQEVADHRKATAKRRKQVPDDRPTLPLFNDEK